MLDGIKFLESNQEQIEKAYVVYLDLMQAKEMIIKKLANIRHDRYICTKRRRGL